MDTSPDVGRLRAGVASLWPSQAKAIGFGLIRYSYRKMLLADLAELVCQASELSVFCRWRDAGGIFKFCIFLWYSV